MGYLLTSTDLANLKHATDILRDSPELPYPSGLHEAVVQDLAQVSRASGFLPVGNFYNSIRDNPVSTLLDFTLFIGVQNENGLVNASEYMTNSSAVELPIHQQVIQNAQSSATGFLSTAQFQNAMRDTPLSTLIAFLKYAGTVSYVSSGDPTIFAGSLAGPSGSNVFVDQSYGLAVTSAGFLPSPNQNTWATVLTWTFPRLHSLMESLAGLGNIKSTLFLQRSPASINTPSTPPTARKLSAGTYAAYPFTSPPTSPDWVTIQSWNYSGLNNPGLSLPTTYTDNTSPSPTYHYRLVQIVSDSSFTWQYEIDWEVETASRVAGGAALWAKTLGGTANDGGTAVTTDSSSNVYVTGYFQGTVDFGGVSKTSTGGYDMFLAKYSSAGTLTWVKSFGKSGDENPTCIALDPSGNIFVGGYFTGTANFGGTDLVSHGSQDAFIAKYSSTGTHIASLGFGGIVSDSVTSIAADSAGNVIATGWYQSDVNPVDVGNTQLPRSWGQADSFLIKLNAGMTSTTFAKNFYNGSADYGRGVMVDGSDNIILVGYFNGNINLGTGQFDANWFTTPGGYIAKYNSSGTLVWSKRYGGTQTVTRFWAAALSPKNGDILVSGDFSQNTDLGSGTITATSYGVDLFVAGFSSTDGTLKWVNPIHGTGPSLAQETSMSVDSAGNVLVTGNYQGTYTFGTQALTSAAGVSDGFWAKYNSAGTAVWAHGFGSVGYATGNGIATDVSGNVLVTGFFSGTLRGVNNLAGVGGYDGVLFKASP